MSRRSVFVTIALCLMLSGCRIQWVPDGPSIVDPNPPVVERSLRVVIVEETADRPALPSGQLAILTSPVVRRWLDANCDPLGDGTRSWRIVDKDAVGGLPAELRGACEHAAESMPWLYVTDGTNGLSCPLPDSVDAFVAKIKPFAKGVSP